MPYIQEDDYRNGTRFDSEEIEDRFDQDCAERQDLKAEIERCPRIPETSDMSGDELVQELLQAARDVRDAMANADDVIQALRDASDDIGAADVVARGSTEPRTLTARLADVINALDFGAKGDGETDDTAALNAAMTAAAGRRLFIPAGTYLTSTGLRIPTDTEVFGDGWTSTVIKLTADSFAIPCVTNDANVVGEEASNTGNWRITLRDLCVDGNGYRANGTGSSGHSGSAISWKNAHNVVMQNVIAVRGRLHCLDIASSKYDTLFDPDNGKDWRIGASSDVRVENFIGYDACVDDVITTHYSHRIQLVNCYTYAQNNDTRPFSLTFNQCGIEIDDGSYDVEVRGCYATGFCRGIVSKAHNNGDTNEAAIPAKEVYFYDCCAEGNNINFEVMYHGLASGRVPGKTAFYNCRSLQPVEILEATSANPTCYFYFYGRQKSLVIDGLTCIGLPNESSNYCIYINPLSGGDYHLNSLHLKNISFEKVNVDTTGNAHGDSLIRLSGNMDSMAHISGVMAQACGDVPVIYNTSSFMHYINDINAWKTGSSNAYVVKMNYALAGKHGGKIEDVVFSGYAGSVEYGNYDLEKQIQDFSVVPSGSCEKMLYQSSGDVLYKKFLYYRNGSAVPTSSGVGIAFGRDDSAGELFDATIETSCANSDAVGALTFCVRKKNDSDVTKAWQIQAQNITTGDTLCFRPVADNVYSLGRSGYRCSEVWAGTGSIQTSDERMKQQIAVLPDAVLDAWGDVEWKQYKFNDAVEAKGEAARLHSGIVAQQIESTFSAHGLNAFAYGLIGHDVHEAVLDENGNEIEPAIDQYSVRYDECHSMEAAYQRRRAERLEERLAQLEERVNQLTNNNNN